MVRTAAGLWKALGGRRRLCSMAAILMLVGAVAATPPAPQEVIVQARLLHRTDLEAATRMVDQALRGPGLVPNSREHCDLLLLASECAGAQGHFRSGQAQVQQAIAIAAILGDPLREAHGLRQQGRLERHLGQYSASMHHLERAEATFEARGQMEDRARCLEEKGLVLRALGDLTRALEHLHRARSIFEQQGAADHQAQLRNNLGLLQLELGLRDEARSTFEEGMRMAEIGGFRGTLSILQENMSDLLMQQGRYEEARALLDRALELQRRDKRWRNYSSTLIRKGQFHTSKGEWAEAEPLFREALRVKEEIEEPFGVATVLLRLGLCVKHRGDLEQAQQHLERAARIARETRAQGLESEALLELARVYKGAAQIPLALEALERHVGLQALIDSEESRARLAVIQNRMELERRTQEIQFLKRIQMERESDLRRAHRLRNIILGVTGLAVLLAAALYGRYRQVRGLYQALAESETRFRALAEQAPVGAWILQDGVVQYVNAEMASFFGATPETVRGRRPEAFIRCLEAAVAPGPGQAQTVVPEGRGRHLEFYEEELDLQGRAATLEVFIDVTRRHEVEEELARYRESLQELVEERTLELREAHQELLMRERLSTLGRLTATVAHELRNPLGAIRSSLFTLGKGLPPEAEVLGQKALALAERSILRCEGLVQELLAFSSNRPLHREPTDLDFWLEEVLDDYVLPEGIVLERHLGSVPELDVDRERLRRAVINVLENGCQAIQAREGGGHLRVTLEQGVGEVGLSVEDDGVGIPEAHLPQVFEPLFSTKSFGSGLGLAVVKESLERHGGSVELESREGEGTRVRLRIPT